MYKLTVAISMVFLALLAGAQQPDPFFTGKIAAEEQKGFSERLHFAENENYGLYDLIYQRMEWNVNPAVRFIDGKIVSWFTGRSNNLAAIEFDLEENMQVDSVLQNSSPAGFVHEGDRLIISLNNTLMAGETDSVVVYYQGIPDPGGFGSFTVDEHNGIPILWTLSEPYGAMDWWPCKQSLTDKIDSIDVIVTSPELYRTASHGVLVSEFVEGGFRTMHWRHRYPIVTYLVAIAVTNYVDYSHFVDMDQTQLEIRNFVYPEYLETAQSATPATVDLIEFFNELIGDYPFAREKYGHAQFGWGGGMEHQTISFMVNFNFDLVAHELAHQWFGDYITLASWHDIWLNEGFATYLTGLAYENLLEGVWWPVWKRSNVNRIVSVPGGSVYVQDTTNISRLFSGRLSYSKGAYLLHMLRWVLGDEAFFSGLRNYYEDPEVANGFARHEDFVGHMEAVGDTSLTEFFDDWYYNEGYPVYNLIYSETSDNRYLIRLLQNPSHESVSFFEMPVPVRAYSFNRSDSADFRLIHTENNQEFLVDPGFEVNEMVVDPDYWLVSRSAVEVKSPLVDLEKELLVYPNPVKNELNVYLPEDHAIQSVAIFNSMGQLMLKQENQKNTISVNSLARGVYLVEVTTARDRFIRQIVKQ